MSSGTHRVAGLLRQAQDAVTLACPGQATVGIQLAGTWTATVVFEVSLTKDTWIALNVAAPNSTSTVTGATANGLWVGPVAGLEAIRVRCSAFTSGEVSVLLQAVSVGGSSAGGSGGGGGGAVTIADGADVTQGAVADAAWTSGSGTVISLLKKIAGAGGVTSAVTIADGDDATEGLTTAVKVVGDNSGTVSGKLRGLNYLWALVVDTANSWVKVNIQNTSVAVTGPLTDTQIRASAVPVSLASAPTTAVTIADGAAATVGAKADAKSTATDTTPISAMSVWKQISASVQLFVFGAGTAAAAQRTTLASDDPAVAALGATTGAKVITDANGTIQQYLRGLVYILITSGQAFMKIALSSVLNVWNASSNLTVTNLNSLAASATFIAGWQSAVIDLSAATDARITAKLTGTSSNNQAGTAFLYLVGLLDDSTWPAGAGGGEGTLTPTGGASIIGAVFRIGAVTTIDNSAGRIYYLDCPSVRAVFNGAPVKKVVIYITGNGATSTNAQFAASGNQVTVVTQYGTLGA